MKTRVLVAEFLGVFALCFIGILAIYHLGSVPGGLLGIALAHGLTITAMIAAFISTSGAHFNPAVSLALLITKRIDGKTCIGYVLAQFAGGGVAAVLAMMMFSSGGAEVVAAGTPAVGGDFSVIGALISEIVGTFLLVTVIYGSAVDKRAPAGAPLYIGFVIVAIILAVGPIGGAALNPARYLGPALVGGVDLSNAWLWFVGPLVGGGLAGVVYDQVVLKPVEAEGDLAA